MSEQANIQVVRDSYAAFQRGDIPSLLENLTEDIEWIEPPVEPLGGTYRGRASVADFFKKVNETSEFSHFEPRDFIAQGDRVVVLGHYRATVRGTGRAYECDWAMAFTLTGGKISRFQEFTDTAAFAAALPAGASAASA